MTAFAIGTDKAMVVSKQHPSIVPSLLDRLIDEDPGQALEIVPLPAVRLEQVKAAVRRDLENLLNTRLYRRVPLDAYPELARSVVNYGLPDFSTVLLGSAEHREHFRRTVQATIERFETRLRRVQVTLAPTAEEYQRSLHLKISALLMIEPAPVPLLFDSRVRAHDREVKLRELRHG